MLAFLCVVLLVCSNAFMTVAWYGHLKVASEPWFQKLNLGGIILLSWLVALFEYCFQVPANRLGFQENGGPFSLIQLKVLQEVISLAVFTVFSVAFFKNETLRWNHGVAAAFLVGAVYFAFKE